ncbi:MAG: winged helix-turn-helix domain-containing protein [Candidatus Hodarchaeales archaeon]|jgi:DNA-binding transcriptional ArsR family regulator
MVSSTTKSSASAKEKEEEKHRILYDFWESIPLVTFIETSEKNYKSHPIRPGIMNILRLGIIEGDNIQTKGKQRYALNPQEILDLLNSKDRQIRQKYALNDEQLLHFVPISKTNLYFHLGKLEKAGFIKEVAKILEGRHKIAYYGRTSRIFFLDDTPKKLNYYKELFNEFSAFSAILGNEVDPEQLNQTVNHYVETLRSNKQATAEWLAKNAQKIYENNLDIGKIMEAAYLIDSINPEIVTRLKAVNELFQEVLSTIHEDTSE